ncbi:hypothetical protein Ddye_012668 [Dipteronia dyeriana]|uniref:FAR1 domain-containing protein n=1 Tax=Dipteronia dyeriana TaxID=168575 RepID=A0AAE0CIV2_9ROSI|nr:hypothetical protein Ddye_012668 [Dipteronia dyeriana]
MNVEQLMAPYVGMFFETMEQARNYYENYGLQEGFWISIRSSSKARLGSNEVTSIKFVCAYQGKYKRSRELVEDEKDDKEITDGICSSVCLFIFTNESVQAS